MIEVLIKGQGDNTRYLAESKAPAAGGRKFFRKKVSKLARELLVDVSDKDFDHLMKRQLHHLNFNKFEEHSAKIMSNNKVKKKDQLQSDFTALRDQFVIFEQLFACVAGPSSARARTTSTC